MKRYTGLTKRYVHNNKKRAVITTITITLAMTIMISFTMIYNAQEKGDIRRSKNETGYYDAVFRNLNREQYDKLRKDDRITSLECGKQEGALVPKSDDLYKENGYNLVKLTRKAYENIFKMDLIGGRIPSKENEILVDYKTAKSMDIDLGEEVEFEFYPKAERINNNGPVDDTLILDMLPLVSLEKEKSIGEKKDLKYKLVGISKNMSKGSNIYGFSTYEYIYNNNEIDSFVTVRNNKVFQWGAFSYGDEKAIAEDLGVNFRNRQEFSPTGEIRSQVRYPDNSLYNEVNSEDTVQTSSGNSTLVIIIVSIFMFIAIFNMFNISVYQRIRELGMLRAIGASTKQISRIVLREANIYAIIGIVLGGVVGYLLTIGIFIPVTQIINVQIPQEYLNIDINQILKNGFIVYVMVIWSASSGMSKQIKMTPVEAINTFTSNKDDNNIIVGKNKFIEANKKIEIKLAYKNLYNNILRNNMCTLIIGISMVLFIFYISSFLTGLNIVTTSLPSTNWDMEIMGLENKSGDELLSNDEINQIENVEGVDKIYSNNILSVELSSEGIDKGELLNEISAGQNSLNADIRVVDKRSIDIYKKYLVDGSIDYDNLNKNGILVVNSGAKRYNLGGADQTQFSATDKLLNINIGDNMPIDNELFVKKNFNIQGILSKDALRDNSNMFDSDELVSDFKIIITKECYEKELGPLPEKSIFIKTNYGVDREKVKKEINNIVNKKMGNVKDYEEVKKAEEKRVNENLAIQVMFLISLIIIVVINLANTFYASIIMRKRELASMRAIGMSGKQMRNMVVAEVIIIAIEASIWSVSIGGYLTLYKEVSMNKVALGHLDLWLMTVIGSVVIIFIITLLSVIQCVKKVNGLSIVDDLRNEE